MFTGMTPKWEVLAKLPDGKYLVGEQFPANPGFVLLLVFGILIALFTFIDATEHFTGGDIFILDIDHSQAGDDIISGIYRRECFDPRDKAYGVWSVLEQRGAYTPFTLPPHEDVAGTFRGCLIGLRERRIPG